MSIPDQRLAERGPSWKWWVCCLLLLATTINYMDRLTLNLLATHIMVDLGFDELGYGAIESWFAVAFAGGALLFGLAVDRWNVFWVYPLAVLAWSAAGFFSGLAQGLASLIAFRFLLGAAESANWPCALRTTQRILPPGERSMGNSILQSGAALGAILMPQVLFLLFDKHKPSTWRIPFLVVGACGALWVVLWWLSVRRSDLALVHAAPSGGGRENGAAGKPAPPTSLVVRRFAALIVLVISINMTWHFLRAWLPVFLAKRRGFDQDEVNLFATGYYVFTDAGALTAGFVTLRLARRGVPVHASRRLVFLGCALLPLLCLTIPFLPSGWPLVVVLMLIGFGALGVFPNYYSFSQDMTVRHQGKVTGTLGCCCWLAMAVWQWSIPRLNAATGSYDTCFAIAGLAPLVGFLALLTLWGPTRPPPPAPAPEGPGAAPAVVAVPDERVTAAPVGAEQVRRG